MKCTSRLSRARPDSRWVWPSLRPSPSATISSRVLPDERLVLVPGDLVGERHEPFVALLHDRLRYLVVERPRPAYRARLEYWNVNAPANRARSTTFSVSRKSSSVSPGKPTMMSVVIAASGIAARTRSMIPRNLSCR